MEPPTTLNERFIRSTQPMVLLLSFFGLDLRDLSAINHHQSNCQKIAILGWCLFWLILHFLSSFYGFFIRTLRPILAKLFQSSNNNESPAEIIMTVILRLSPIVFAGPFVHLFLILTLRHTIQSIMDGLEILDLKLGRPELTSIRHCSIVATLWILLLVYFKATVFHIYFPVAQYCFLLIVFHEIGLLCLLGLAPSCPRRTRPRNCY